MAADASSGGTSISVRDETAVERIEVFLEDAFNKGPVAEVVLQHVSVQGNNNVGDWNSFEGMGPENLALQIMDRAVDDARAQRGSARYIVTFRRSTEKRGSDGRTWFTLTGGGYDIDGIEDTEGPNGPGLMSQLMRHNEASARIALLSARETIVDYRREVGELRSMVRHMTQAHFKLIETHEKLINEDHKRQLELRKARFDEARQEKVFDQIAQILPIVLRMFAEGKSEVLQDTALKMQVSNLVESLSEEQILDFARRLEPAQQMSFMDLYRQVRAAKGGGIGDKIAVKETREAAASAPPAAAGQGDKKE